MTVQGRKWSRLPALLPALLPLILLVLLAITFRIVYYTQLNHSPCVVQHQWNQTDMNYFDLWAKTISSGDLLSKNMPHAHHYWHGLLAREAEGTDRSTDEQGRSLWDHWYGKKVFHQEPLFPYFVASVYKLLGEEVRWVFLFQMISGLLSLWLVFRITSRHFGTTVGWLAATLAVFCGPMLYYEMLLIRPALITFFGLLLVDRTDLALVRGSFRNWFRLGAVCGGAILLKSTFLLFPGVLFLHLIWTLVWTRSRNWRPASALLLGLGLLLSPAVIRNAVVGAPLFSLSSVGAITFINANAEDYQPEIGFQVSRHASAIMKESDGKMLPAAIATLSTHPDLWSYLKIEWRKFSLIWHWYEIPNNSNYYYYQLHAPILRYLLTFFLLGPLSLLGLLLAASRWKRLWPLFLLGGIYILSMLVFYVLSRFRVYLMVAFIPLAAFAIARMVEWVREKSYRRLSLAALGLVCLTLWMSRPLPENVALIRSEDYEAAYAAYFIPQMKPAAEAGDWPKVVKLIEESLKFEPPIARELGPMRPVRNDWEFKVGTFFRMVHQSLGLALRNSGNIQAALLEEKRGEELARALHEGG